jgi:hypothetical protein
MAAEDLEGAPLIGLKARSPESTARSCSGKAEAMPFQSISASTKNPRSRKSRDLGHPAKAKSEQRPF